MKMIMIIFSNALIKTEKSAKLFYVQPCQHPGTGRDRLGRRRMIPPGRNE